MAASRRSTRRISVASSLGGAEKGVAWGVEVARDCCAGGASRSGACGGACVRAAGLEEGAADCAAAPDTAAEGCIFAEGAAPAMKLTMEVCWPLAALAAVECAAAAGAAVGGGTARGSAGGAAWSLRPPRSFRMSLPAAVRGMSRGGTVWGGCSGRPVRVRGAGCPAVGGTAGVDLGTGHGVEVTRTVCRGAAGWGEVPVCRDVAAGRASASAAEAAGFEVMGMGSPTHSPAVAMLGLT